MRRVQLMALVTVVSLACSVSSGIAGQKMLKGSVYSPEAGTICDKKGGFCADEQGISVSITKMYLGEKAEKKLLGMGDFDMTRFTLTNGVYCEVKIKKCTISKYEDKVDVAHTKALFGSAGATSKAAAAAAPIRAVFSPDSGIICDKQKGFCADSQGISMAFTQEYLGDAAQKKQMALKKKGGYNETFFVLSNGIACNTVDKKCYAGEFDSTVDTIHTKALFGD
jgi:hypothetical protein